MATEQDKALQTAVGFSGLGQLAIVRHRPKCLFWFAAIIVLMAAMAKTNEAADHLTLSGTLGAHDPSSMLKDGSRYYYYATNGYIVSRSSSNMTSWSAGPTVFNSTTLPAWTLAYTGADHPGELWAPDVVYFNGLYHLYYSASSWGSQISAIGMATSPTLNPSSPNYAWTDQGPVIQSTTGSPYNAIDPSIFQNSDGTLWMTFGSYWNGIYQVQLNPTTGMLMNPSSPGAIRLAYNSSIEASAMYRRGDYYYLFVNWGACCQGVNSTYNIRVGRSTSVTGPFRDQNGVNMVANGGTLLQGTEGKYIGPGHFEGYSQAGQDYFTYHYYDGDRNGTPTYGIDYLYWTNNGWPTTAAPDAIWCGAGAYIGCANNSDNLWTTPNNWGGKTPATATELKFGALVAGGYTASQNNIAGTPQYTGLTFQAEAATTYTLQGLPIRLTGLITNSSLYNQVINLDLVLDIGGGSVYAGTGSITIGGAIGETGGPKSLVKIGSAELVLKANNTYTGTTNVNQGTLTLDGGDLADVSTINVANGAQFKVISGSPVVGNIAGAGSTTISGSGTVLTAASIAQNTLTVGSGATVVIQALPGGPLGDGGIRAVPEPGALAMLLIGLAAASLPRVRKKISGGLK
jgi:autotransporter-associated beta strand protein